MLEMLLYSRPGVIELLPALPSAWARSGQRAASASGGSWSTWAGEHGQVTRAVLHSVGGTATTVRTGSWSRNVTVPRRGSVTIVPGAR